MKLFICTYTNRVKDYCDTEFFDNLFKLSVGNPVMIVDNTLDNGAYSKRIETLTHNYPNFNISWLMVPREPARTMFLRNVTESVNLCRDAFLKSDCDHMIVIESDVLPPQDLINRFEEDALWLEGEKWGMVGGLYYAGFHDYHLEGLQLTHHVLSGCTLYNGEMVRDTPFRWSPDNIDAFPDAFISHDAGTKGYTRWNDHRIICEHLNNPDTRTRYSGEL